MLRGVDYQPTRVTRARWQRSNLRVLPLARKRKSSYVLSGWDCRMVGAVYVKLPGSYPKTYTAIAAQISVGTRTTGVVSGFTAPRTQLYSRSVLCTLRTNPTAFEINLSCYEDGDG